MKWGDVTNADLEGALLAIKYGHDPVAAKNLIEYFYERIHGGASFNERVLHGFLDHAFGKVAIEGWSADQAFGLKLKKGHHERANTFERDVIAAAFMVLLMQKKNWRWQDAKGEAANNLFPDGRGEKAVEKAYKSYGIGLKGLPEDYLVGLLPPDLLRSYRAI